MKSKNNLRNQKVYFTQKEEEEELSKLMWKNGATISLREAYQEWRSQAWEGDEHYSKTSAE